MPRGKYVNHKGRGRRFTSPEELQQENDESSDESSSGEEEGAAGGTSSSGPKKWVKGRGVSKQTGSSDESDEEESSEGEDRDARKGVASLIEIENPNRSVKKATQKVANLNLDEGEPHKPELTRREREQLEKQKAKLRYEKLHAAGKTNEAKADLARLALIRQQRAEAAAKREAEKKSADDKRTPTK